VDVVNATAAALTGELSIKIMLKTVKVTDINVLTAMLRTKELAKLKRNKGQTNRVVKSIFTNLMHQSR
jgi:hypothetical protein